MVQIGKGLKRRTPVRPVYSIEPEGNMWRLKNIFGDQKAVHGAFKAVGLTEDKIVLQGVERD